MKRTVWMAAVIACATTLGVAAQTPSTTTSKAMDNTADKITVTGCLQEGSRSSTGTTSSASTTSGTYILANATTGSGSASTTAGTTSSPTTAGTTGTTGATTAGSTAPVSYVLDGRDSDLKNHVGHRIEVSGTLDTPDRAAASPTSTTTSGSASSRMDTSAPRLKVSSVRMIAAECPSR
jgi:hypothetical protein